jgi:hypothetical protein
MKYSIIKAESPERLAELVNERIAQAPSCRPVGGPFTGSWAPGHGYVHRCPRDLDHRDLWVYVEFMQAVVED